MKIESVGTSLLIKAQPIEQKTDSVVIRKPLVNSTKVKQVAIKVIQKPLESKVNSEAKDGKCYHKWFEWGFAQQLIQYACDVSNYDVDFILTLQHENWSWDYQKQSNVVKNGVREKSFGMCQVMRDYHKKTIYENLPYSRIKESRYLTDWKYQIETCYKLYKWGTAMYWYKYRYKGNKGLIFINWHKY